MLCSISVELMGALISWCVILMWMQCVQSCIQPQIPFIHSLTFKHRHAHTSTEWDITQYYSNWILDWTKSQSMWVTVEFLNSEDDDLQSSRNLTQNTCQQSQTELKQEETFQVVLRLHHVALVSICWKLVRRVDYSPAMFLSI